MRATAAVHSCQPAGFRRCDKGYDQKRFVREARERNITPHVTQNTSHRRSAIDGRTTRHPGCHVSQQCRKLVEQTFGGTRQLACWPSCAIADKATLTQNTVAWATAPSTSSSTSGPHPFRLTRSTCSASRTDHDCFQYDVPFVSQSPLRRTNFHAPDTRNFRLTDCLSPRRARRALRCNIPGDGLPGGGTDC